MSRSPNLQRLLFLGLSGPIVALNVWLVTQFFRYFEHLITLLVTAAILAFLLNYPVRLFQRIHLKRPFAVTLVLGLTIALFVVLGFTLVPILVDQTLQLVDRIPGWLSASQDNLRALDNWAKSRHLHLDLQGFSGRLTAQIESQLQTFAAQAVGVAIGTLGGLVDSILILVLAFYMLLDGDRLWQGLIKLIPPRIAIPLSQSLWLNLHNFFISQILLALFMAAVLIPTFLVMRVPFTLLFALLIGIAELIPFIGATIGIGLITLLIALQDLGLAVWVCLVCVLLQQLRDNILAPRLMGGFTGLNPLWILIALLIGLQIAGFLGVLMAVPIAGTIKGTLEALQQEAVNANELKQTMHKRGRWQDG